MLLVGIIIDWVLWIFLLILFARMILSWVPVLVRDWEPRGPMLVFAEIIYSITDPPLRLLRKVLRPGPGWLDDARPGLHRAGDRCQHLDADQPERVVAAEAGRSFRSGLTKVLDDVWTQIKLGTVVRMGVRPSPKLR